MSWLVIVFNLTIENVMYLLLVTSDKFVLERKKQALCLKKQFIISEMLHSVIFKP